MHVEIVLAMVLASKVGLVVGLGELSTWDNAV